LRKTLENWFGLYRTFDNVSLGGSEKLRMVESEIRSAQVRLLSRCPSSNMYLTRYNENIVCASVTYET
jgi:hypothetical protein